MQCYQAIRKAASAAVSPHNRAILRSHVQGMSREVEKPVWLL